MAYLDKIELRPGEVLPPKFSLVYAGRNDTKIAVRPHFVSGTFGRYKQTDEGRRWAIKAAWEAFPFTQEVWEAMEAAVDYVRRAGGGPFCICDAVREAGERLPCGVCRRRAILATLDGNDHSRDLEGTDPGPAEGWWRCMECKTYRTADQKICVCGSKSASLHDNPASRIEEPNVD